MVSVSLFDKLCCHSKNSNVTYHKYSACLLNHKNKIVAIATNSQDGMFKAGRCKKPIPSTHAEVAVILDFLRRIKMFRKRSDKKRRYTLDMIVLQFRTNGEAIISKPCASCMEFIKAINPLVRIKKVYYYGETTGFRQSTSFINFTGWEHIVKSLRI